MTIEEIQQQFDSAVVHRVKLGTVDIDGILRGKHISRQKFESVFQSGTGFCDVIFGWDIADVLYDGVPVTITGWQTGYPDAVAKIDLSSFRLIPWEPGTAFFLVDLYDKHGQPLPMSPRNLLRRVLDRALKLGYQATLAAEYEFFIFKESAESLRAKSWRNLTPLSPGMFGYSVLRSSMNSGLVLDLMDSLNRFHVPLEGFHTETGPGVYEAAIQVDTALGAADKAALFKTAVKEICARHQVTPTFMAKWNQDLPGCSGHLHQSLWSGGHNLFHAAGGDDMSDRMRGYIAGLVHHLPSLMPMYCPTINSYKRTVPGTWAPINATWGLDNRTTAVRAIPGGAKSARIEMRICGADINPYIAMAGCLASGLDGVERNLELPPATANAYTAAGAPPLPRNLATATEVFRRSELARDWFGDAFVDHYAATREWEVRQSEKAVTDWELARYFESI